MTNEAPNPKQQEPAEEGPAAPKRPTRALDTTPTTKKTKINRQKLYTLLSLFYLLLVLSAVVGINLIVARFPVVIDVGGSLARTLRPDTLKILAGLRSEVELVAFLPEGAAAARARALFSELEAASEYIHARVLDPEADPAAVKEAKLNEGERVILRAEGRESQLPSVEEISLAQALARVTATKRRDVCFGVEHGERSLDDTEPGGISRATQLLTRALLASASTCPAWRGKNASRGAE